MNNEVQFQKWTYDEGWVPVFWTEIKMGMILRTEDAQKGFGPPFVVTMSPVALPDERAGMLKGCPILEKLPRKGIRTNGRRERKVERRILAIKEKWTAFDEAITGQLSAYTKITDPIARAEHLIAINSDLYLAEGLFRGIEEEMGERPDLLRRRQITAKKRAIWQTFANACSEVLARR